MKKTLRLFMVVGSIVLLVFALNIGVASAHSPDGLDGTNNARDHGAGSPTKGGGGALHEDGHSDKSNQNGIDQSNSNSPICRRHLNENHVEGD